MIFKLVILNKGVSNEIYAHSWEALCAKVPEYFTKKPTEEKVVEDGSK
jgi:hypothetical protein